MHLPHRKLSVGLFIAVVVTAVATLIRMALAPVVGEGAPFTIYLVGVVVTAWFGGFWPGFASTVLGYLVAEALFVHPLHAVTGPFAVGGPVEAVRFFSYAVVGVAISFVSEQWHRVRVRDLDRAKRLEQEVAERLRAVEELRQSKQTLEAVIATAPIPIVVIEPDRTVRLWNLAAEQVFGWKAEEVLGRDIPIVPDEKCEECRSSRAAVSRGQTLGPIATYRRRKDGSRVEVELSVAPLYNADQRVDSMVLLLNDVTERRRTERSLRESRELLREADRRKDAFLATLAHELRNPLAPIRNALQVMQLARVDVDAMERSRQMIERQLGQMVRLIDDLIDVSRITSGKIELRNQVISLQDVIASALETSRPLIDAMEHELTLTLPEEPVVMHADLTRLAQAFANILQNAAKYTERGGRVALVARREGSRVVVSIADTGIGIAPEILPKVFGLFTQGDPTLAVSRGGLGVGLTLVKQLIEAHGGSVEARSAGPGHGSEFVVTLPATEAPRAMERRPGAAGTENGAGKGAADAGNGATDAGNGAAESGSSSPGARAGASLGAVCRRVLIVDDNADSVESLAELVRLMGHDCATALDGEGAVAMARSYRPDTVLLDIGMPGMNGYDACRAIRSEPWGKELLLVALTGWGQAEDRVRTREAGFDHHIVKPVEPRTLSDLLAKPLPERAAFSSQP